MSGVTLVVLIIFIILPWLIPLITVNVLDPEGKEGSPRHLGPKFYRYEHYKHKRYYGKRKPKELKFWNFTLTNFITNSQFETEMPRVEDFFCNLKSKAIGKTESGTKILDIHIALKPEATVLIIGGVYANDWPSFTSILHVIAATLRCKRNRLIPSFDWRFIPLMNPDGYSSLYENATGDLRTTFGNLNGVNLNRNFGTQFVADNESGSAAFSERESVAVRDYVKKIKNIELAIVVAATVTENYAKKDLILYPWWYSLSDHERAGELAELCESMKQRAHLFKDYICQKASDAGAKGGTLLDWLADQIQVKRVFNIDMKLRPDDFKDEFTLVTNAGEDLINIIMSFLKIIHEQINPTKKYSTPSEPPPFTENEGE